MHFSFYLFFLLHYFFLSLFVLAACFDLSYLSLPRVNFLSNKLCGFRQERILSALTLLRLCGQLALIGMWYGPFHISEQAPRGNCLLATKSFNFNSLLLVHFQEGNKHLRSGITTNPDGEVQPWIWSHNHLLPQPSSPGWSDFRAESQQRTM